MARARPVDTTEAPVGICYSGGTSSRWLVESILNGTIKRPENVAVFTADTGDEHEWTYDDIDAVEEKCKREGVPFVRCADPMQAWLDLYHGLRMDRRMVARRLG